MNSFQLFMKFFHANFSQASMLAKLAIIFNVGLTYFVLKLYENSLTINAKVNDCQEARVKDLTAILMKVQRNSEALQETNKEVDEIKAQKLSYNE